VALVVSPHRMRSSSSPTDSPPWWVSRDPSECRLCTLSSSSGAAEPLLCAVPLALTHTLPTRSPHGTWECATRSWWRLRNLAVARGPPGARLRGPIAYTDNVEQPHRYAFTVDPARGRYHPHDLTAAAAAPSGAGGLLLPPPPVVTTIVSAVPTIVSGVQWQAHALPSAASTSLFARPGRCVLPVAALSGPDGAELSLSVHDARTVDLSPYGARLVRNDVPFRWITQAVAARDEPRVVVYEFEAGYAAHQESALGPGHFVERHAFPQAFTPCSPTQSRGWLLLGTWRADAAVGGSPPPPHLVVVDDRCSSEVGTLTLLAVAVPYGWTLLADPWAVHGDTTLVGPYLMAMTSDHHTMATADTVLLRTPTDGNVRLRASSGGVAPPRLATVGPTRLQRREQQPAAWWQLVVQPLAVDYWRSLFTAVGGRGRRRPHALDLE
jgi:hypothetical protein